jgi:VWFA-related protein
MFMIEDEPLQKGRARAHRMRLVWGVSGLAVLLATLCVPPVNAQQTEDPVGRFAGEVSVNVVTVDVVVTDKKGRPILGLEREDFRVFEDGVEMDITNYLAVRGGRLVAGGEQIGESRTAEPPAKPVEPAPVPPASDRYLVVYVDHVFLVTQSTRRLIPQLTRFLREEVPSGTRMMLAAYDGTVKIRVPFTEDVNVVVEALEAEMKTAGVGNLRAAEGDLTFSTWAMAENAANSMGDGGAFTSGEALADVNAQRQAAYDALEEDYRAVIRRDWRNLQYFIDSFAGLPGRKVLLHVSDGVPSRPDFWDDPTGGARSTASRAPVPQALMRELAEVVAHASTLGVTIHTVYGEGGNRGVTSGTAISSEVAGRSAYGRTDQMRAMRFNSSANSVATLQFMAEGTGGLMVIKPNAETLAPLGTDVQSYYSLGYRPPRPGDGAVHKIKVEVDHKKATVRHRERYISLTDRDRVAAQALSALVIEEVANPLDVVWDVPAAGTPAAEGFVVPIQIRLPLELLSMRPDGEAWRGKVRIFVVAQNLEGALAPIHEMAVPLKIPGSLDEHPNAAFVVPAQIALSPGQHIVAVTVLDEMTGVASSKASVVFVESTGSVWRGTVD